MACLAAIEDRKARMSESEPIPRWQRDRFPAAIVGTAMINGAKHPLQDGGNIPVASRSQNTSQAAHATSVAAALKDHEERLGEPGNAANGFPGDRLQAMPQRDLA